MTGRTIYYYASVIFAVAATTTMAWTPVNFLETWESYPGGSVPTGRWYVDPHMADGGLIVMSGELYNHTYQGSNGLFMNYTNGRDAGIQARLVPEGYEVKATDAHTLNWTYYAKADDAQHAEWYVEVSFGDVHAPHLMEVGVKNPLPAPIPVIAYCKPFVEPFPKHKGTYFFDGQQWAFYGYLDNSDMFGDFVVRVGATSMYLQCPCQNSAVDVPRAYLGTFDRVSIYTLDNYYPDYTVLDDIKITGGEVVNSLTVAPEDVYISVGPIGGAFAPGCKTYTVSNITLLPLQWTAAPSQNWMTVTPNSGTLSPGESIEVNACINANANVLPQGLHTNVVTFNDLTHDVAQARDVELYVGQIDSFTEQFAGNNDLGNYSVMLTPDGPPHFYQACAVATNHFPTPPAGSIDLAVSGDNSVKVTLQQGVQVYLYGQAYSEFYVGANGYLTFGEGDTSASGTAVDHFKKKRISGLFTDLAPSAGQVGCKQLMDRVAVTYQNVVKAGTSNANSFQIEMFDDGRIRLTWLNLAATSGLVGLSKGLGIPTNFANSDFSSYEICPPSRYPADFDGDGDVDQSDFGHLQTCLAGQPGFFIVPECADADIDLDGAVGSGDVVAFIPCFSGPNTAPPANCKGF